MQEDQQHPLNGPSKQLEPAPLPLQYGHSEPYFDKPSTAPFWCFLGFALAGVPIFLLGFVLYDIDAVVMAGHVGYTQPHWRNDFAVAFFAVLVAACVFGIVRFHKSPKPLRFVLLGFPAGAGACGLLEGLCFGMK